ncbi:MAG: hypothetical protein FWF26_04100, partial [Treponema sp.]|nr:hypothetical protein [Treponema sp.]
PVLALVIKGTGSEPFPKPLDSTALAPLAQDDKTNRKVNNTVDTKTVVDEKIFLFCFKKRLFFITIVYIKKETFSNFCDILVELFLKNDSITC